MYSPWYCRNMCVRSFGDAGGNTATTEETIVAEEETTQELVPVMARACDNNVYYRANNWNVR